MPTGVSDGDIPSAEKMYKIILDKEKTSEDLQDQKGKPPDKNSEEMEDISSLLEENRELKKQRICKICLDEEISRIFLPCGHLVCCETRASLLSKCPICRGAIKVAARAILP